jgi:ribosomal protein S18 acetylase RimI-like enzyme
MFHIKKMTKKDFPFACQLSNTMNWNATIEDFELATTLEPEGCFVLSDGAKRVALATTVSFGKISWFGNLIVREEYRRKGAGNLLTKHALEYLRSKDVETIGLYAYPHLIGFYEQLGFKKDADFSMLKGKSTPRTEMKPLERIQEADFSSVITFDHHCFGADRTKLLDTIFHGNQNLCYVSKDHSGVKGYIASSVYERIAMVGPLVCVLDGYSSAKSLLGNVLNKLRGFDVLICVQKKEADLLSLLFSSGFREDYRVSRMFLGSSLAPKCIYLPESLERG